MSQNPIIPGEQPTTDAGLLNNQYNFISYTNNNTASSPTQFLNAVPVVQMNMSRDITSVFTPALHIQRMKLPPQSCQCRVNDAFCFNCCCGIDTTYLINLSGPNYLQQFNAHETSGSCANNFTCCSGKAYSTTVVKFGHDASGPQSFKYEKFIGPVPDPCLWVCCCPLMICTPYTKEVKVYDSADSIYLGSIKRGRILDYCIPLPQGQCYGNIPCLFSKEIVHADGTTSFSSTNLRPEKINGEVLCGCCPTVVDQWFESDIVEGGDINSKNFVGKYAQRFHYEGHGKHRRLVLSPLLDLVLPQNASPTDKAIFMASSLLELRA